ncbi:hypothetical protein [Devosia beringensis]|uniref:hypothetical protein n=1 Tax=Devosia beringensis TaxID=2657486 RepID=UPI00186B89EB|nr:hypothetical protein [Devosia beringensis]
MSFYSALRPKVAALCLAAVLAMSVAPQAQDDATAPLTALGKGDITAFADEPVVIAAIMAQNVITNGYDQDKIDALDRQWRAEVGSSKRPLIEATTGNGASTFLVDVQKASLGRYTEILVMDAKGLNVAQTILTSDYWHGDEDNFTATFGATADAVHVGKIGRNVRSQALQSQVSVPVTHPVSGALIGVITVGVDVSMLYLLVVAPG